VPRPVRKFAPCHVTRFLILPNHLCIGEARHFKFRVVIDTEEYECMRDILLPKGCVQSHVTSKCWEISDNISETVQDRNIVAMED